MVEFGAPETVVATHRSNRIMNYAVTELNNTTFNLYSALLAISGILLAVTAATGSAVVASARAS